MGTGIIFMFKFARGDRVIYFDRLPDNHRRPNRHGTVIATHWMLLSGGRYDRYDVQWDTVPSTSTGYHPEVLEALCKNCDRALYEHANRKCLFEPTYFEPAKATYEQQASLARQGL